MLIPYLNLEENEDVRTSKPKSAEVVNDFEVCFAFLEVDGHGHGNVALRNRRGTHDESPRTGCTT